MSTRHTQVTIYHCYDTKLMSSRHKYDNKSEWTRYFRPWKLKGQLSEFAGKHYLLLHTRPRFQIKWQGSVEYAYKTKNDMFLWQPIKIINTIELLIVRKHHSSKPKAKHRHYSS